MLGKIDECHATTTRAREYLQPHTLEGRHLHTSVRCDMNAMQQRSVADAVDESNRVNSVAVFTL
jgi:hypothetical protein